MCGRGFFVFSLHQACHFDVFDWKRTSEKTLDVTVGRAKFFGDSGPYDFPKIWGQNLTGVGISGNSERISPGPIRSEVGHPGGLGLTTGCPTLECIGPGEILSELPEITTLVRFWPQFLENHMAVNLQIISLGLIVTDSSICAEDWDKS